MRTPRTITAIGFAIAILATAISPGLAEPPSFSEPCQVGSMGTCEVGRALYRAQKYEQERKKMNVWRGAKIPSAGLGPAVPSVIPKGTVTGLTSTASGIPTRVPPVKAATTHEMKFKPIERLAVKPPPKAASTHEMKFTPIERLAVKPPVPTTPQARGYGR